eukprot:scaffold138324_cov39-Tisochrysis_lutea.AAC.2
MCRRESAGMQAQAEAQLRSKVQAFKASQRLEMEALLARIERGRSEHRGHWTVSAQRLMQAHKNMLSDLETRQNLAMKRAHVTVKTEIVPIMRQQRASADLRRAHVRALDTQQRAPPLPKQRPSRMASDAPMRKFPPSRCSSP